MIDPTRAWQIASRRAYKGWRANVSQAPRPRDEPTAAGPPRWDELVRRLVAYARRLGASSEEAEDLAQESLEIVVRDPAWFERERASLVTALSTVLRNRLFDRHRHLAVRQRVAPALRLVQGDEEPDPHDALALADARERRRALLALLEPAERQVFAAWLRQRRGELDGPDAAASLGMEPSDYEAAKKRLRRRCRTLLDELGLDPDDLFDPHGGGAR